MARVGYVFAGIFLLFLSELDRTSCKTQIDINSEDHDYDKELIKKVFREVQDEVLKNQGHRTHLNKHTPREYVSIMDLHCKIDEAAVEWSAKHYGLIAIITIVGVILTGSYFRKDGNEGRAVVPEDVRARRLRKLGGQGNSLITDGDNFPSAQKDSAQTKGLPEKTQHSQEQLGAQLKNESQRGALPATRGQLRQRPLHTRTATGEAMGVPKATPQPSAPQCVNRGNEEFLDVEEQKQAADLTGKIELSSIEEERLTAELMGNHPESKVVPDVSSGLTPTSGQNIGKRRESSTKELPIDSLIKRILPQLLDCTLEFQEKTSMSPLTKDPPSSVKIVLNVQQSEIPVDEHEVNKKMERLIVKRMCAEMDPLKFAIQCFDRCTRQPGKLLEKNSKGPLMWERLTSVVKEHCINTTIKDLIRVPTSPVSVEEDLYADFESPGQSEATQNYFLSCLGGWSSDGVTVSSELLSILLERGQEDRDLKDTLVNLVSIAGCRIDDVKRLNEVALQCGGIFRGLETLLSQPSMVRFLAEALEKEVKQSVKEMGVFFQDKSIFSSFLSVTSIEAKVDQKSRASVCFTEIPNFPRVQLNDVEPVQTQILDGVHACQNTVRRALWAILSQQETKECALTWVAAVVSLNEMRLLSSQPAGGVQQVVASDGFMLNLCTVLLQLCEPFFIGKKGSKFQQIDPAYCTSDACRLSYNNERTVVGTQICKENDEKADPLKNLFLPDELKGKHKLMTEMFHITHRALGIGLTSTIQHYKKLLRQYLVLHEMKQGTPLEAETKVLLLLFTTQWDTVMQDDHLIRLCSQFYLTTAVWLQQLLDRCSANSEGLSEKQIHMKQQEVFSKIPEFYVKSMCSWFTYVADHKPSSLRGLDMCLFVDCCVTLIQRPDLMPSPVAAARIVSCLLSFSQCTSRKRRKSNLLATNSWGSGVEGDLTASVTMCPAMREKLGPGLVRTYCSVDAVEGLDVDKDEFDKFSARHEIIKLLEHLWGRPDCRGSVLAECGKPSFQDFLGAILDSLMYLLNDSLSRLANVRSIQQAKEDGESWSRLSSDERAEKEQFLKNEEHVSKSFMEMANVTLAFLERITEENDVARCFNKAPLSQRSSKVIIGFLDTLCGRKSLDLKVKNKEKYSFNPHDLVLKIVTVLIRISKGACPKPTSSTATKLKEINECMAVDPDYCKTTMEKALRVLRGHLSSASEIVRELETLISKIESMIKWKEQLCSVDLDMPPTEQSDESDTANNEASGNAVDDYVTALEQKKFDVVELVETHAFRSRSQQPISSRACKVRALMRETTQLRENLPIHPNAAIFVRQDENRMDFARAVVTGPADTPYSRGCFVFDVYFPASYPSDPPLVKLITTGLGTVRFNPNLYADGKVCLSLLGTWHGGDASEKWDPQKSSLYQVLVSIQGMIFIPDPYFNEPGYEGIRGTSEGDARSEKYNAGIRLATVRHAMVGVLQQPPFGCEEVIHNHFRLQKELVWKQCAEWLEQCADDEEKRRMRIAMDDLRKELDKL